MHWCVLTSVKPAAALLVQKQMFNKMPAGSSAAQASCLSVAAGQAHWPVGY
jgi:hypothetical protein